MGHQTVVFGGVQVPVLPYTIFVSPEAELLVVDAPVLASLAVIDHDSNGRLMVLFANSLGFCGALVNLPEDGLISKRLESEPEIEFLAWDFPNKEAPKKCRARVMRASEC